MSTLHRIGTCLAPALALAVLAAPAPAQCTANQGTDTALPDPLTSSGQLIDVEGTLAVVGSIHDDANGLTAGAAFVYRFNGASWRLEATLRPGDVVAQDHFGSSVALSGDTIVVGADHHDAGGVDAGAAYVFTFDGSAWNLEQELVPASLTGGEGFGGAVALEGDRLLVGAATQGSHGLNAGAVYAYTRDGAGWSRPTQLVPGDVDAGDLFGAALAIDGGRAIVGAFGDESDIPGASNTGSAYVFREERGGWALEGRLFPDDPEARAFGGAVGLDGTQAIVGAPNTSVPVTSGGAAWVFHLAGADWELDSRLVPPPLVPGDRFGTYVAIEEGSALVDMPEPHVFPSPPGPGHVQLYTRQGAGWTRTDGFTAALPGFTLARFGGSLVLEDGVAWMTANTSDQTTGAVAAALIGYDLDCPGASELGAAFCFGDGSGAACPCGNESAPGAGQGCANSGGAGALLLATGSSDVDAHDLRFEGRHLVAGQPALLFAGRSAVAGGDGAAFGDGLRCAGQEVLRLGVSLPGAGGVAVWGPGVEPPGGWPPGETRHFQAWFRDPVGDPCGAGFNLSQGLTIGFTG